MKRRKNKTEKTREKNKNDDLQKKTLRPTNERKKVVFVITLVIYFKPKLLVVLYYNLLKIITLITNLLVLFFVFTFNY